MNRWLALAEAATPGPWHAADRGIGWEVHHGPIAPGSCWDADATCRELNDGMKDTFSEADAAFIAASREAVVRLGRDWLRMREMVDRQAAIVTTAYDLNTELQGELAEVRRERDEHLWMAQMQTERADRHERERDALQRKIDTAVEALKLAKVLL